MFWINTNVRVYIATSGVGFLHQFVMHGGLQAPGGSPAAAGQPLQPPWQNSEVHPATALSNPGNMYGLQVHTDIHPRLFSRYYLLAACMLLLATGSSDVNLGKGWE